MNEAGASLTHHPPRVRVMASARAGSAGGSWRARVERWVPGRGADANFDIVKLDRSLAAQISPKCPRPQWLDEVAPLTQSTRLAVVAEGIETEQQLVTIRGAGVQFAQGFYFSRPLAADDFLTFHRDALVPWPGSLPLAPPIA